MNRVFHRTPNRSNLPVPRPAPTACACNANPEVQREEPAQSGCVVCGADLAYFQALQDCECHYCGRTFQANARCARGHFVCDACHSAGPVQLITEVCLHGREPDAVALLHAIRAHPRFGLHGPEHHALVPAVILAALRNAGEAIPEGRILTAIERGRSVPGGAGRRLRLPGRLRRGHRGGHRGLAPAGGIAL